MADQLKDPRIGDAPKGEFERCIHIGVRPCHSSGTHYQQSGLSWKLAIETRCDTTIYLSSIVVNASLCNFTEAT